MPPGVSFQRRMLTRLGNMVVLIGYGRSVSAVDGCGVGEREEGAEKQRP